MAHRRGIARPVGAFVAVISNGAVNIVVKSRGLTAAEVAQINTIVYEQTGISPDKIVIIEKT